MPTDPAQNRLMVEVHYYTPWNFCGMNEDATWGKMFYFWGQGNHSQTNPERNPDWGEESALENYFKMMKTKFVDNGFPVVLGEFGAIKRNNLSSSDRSLHIASREYFNKYVAKSCIRHGLIPVYWDNGASDFSLFNRNTGAVTDRGVVDALMEGAGVTIETSAQKKFACTGSYEISVDLKPDKDAICLSVSNPNQIRGISVFDQAGRRVINMKSFAVNRSVRIGQELKAGIYIVKIHDLSGSRYFKVVKGY